jgi:hypothetical protein
MKLTVFGATGGVGREVVNQALDRGDHITAYVRNPAKLDITDPNLTVISGELTDREEVRRAVRAADAVISALGPSLDRKATGMPLVDGTRAIVGVMQAEGVERYIGMATPSLRDPRDTSSLLGLIVPFMGRTFLSRLPRAAGHVATRHRQPPRLDDRALHPPHRRRPHRHRARRLPRPRPHPRQHHPRRHRNVPARPEHRPPLPPLRARHQQLRDRSLSCHRTSENSVPAKFAEYPFHAIGCISLRAITHCGGGGRRSPST